MTSAVVFTVLGLLVPGLATLREASREAFCSAQQRRLHVAAMVHAQSDQDRLPGVNTTGAAYLTGAETPNKLLGVTTPTTPTSVFDWISPIMGVEANLSPNRAERTRQIFDDLGCPSARDRTAALWGAAGVADAEDFRAVVASSGFLQISYLSPGPFHLAGTSYRTQGSMRTFGWRGPAVPPSRYLPRLDRVGAVHAEKVWVSDGTRYLATPSLLDFDIHPRPAYYGSFTSSTPVYVASREFGAATHSPEFSGEKRPGDTRTVYPHNAKLSYRHGGEIITLRFDGSAVAMTEPETKADATPWFPGGSTFTGVNATAESQRTHRRDETIR